MAATTHTTDIDVDDDPDAHPDRTKLYVIVALFLAALTVVEVLTYAIPEVFAGGDSRVITATLMILMAVKFWTVTYFFMHLKFDKKLLTTVFYAGLALAVLVYVAILAAFRFWGPPGTHMVKR